MVWGATDRALSHRDRRRHNPDRVRRLTGIPREGPARAYLYATAAAAWRDLTETGKLSEEHRASMRLASTWTIHQSAQVVDAAYHMAGATAVFRSNKFERRFRDMHAIAQQIQARDTHYEDVGKALLAGGSGMAAKPA